MNNPELLMEEHNRGLFSNVHFNNFNLHLLSCLKWSRSVHPSQPGAPAYSEFFNISSKKRLRIIHIKPGDESTDPKFQQNSGGNSSRRSFRLSTEEYWFTRWNRSVRNGLCNCSFRKSQRFSKESNQLSLTPNKPNSSLLNKNGTVSSYADKLISDIFVAAFKEFNVNHLESNTKSFGVINLGFDKNDELDTAVSFKDNINQSYTTSVQNLSNDLNNLNNVQVRIKNKRLQRMKCFHSEKKKKPMVLLLHGIGSSADVWWEVLQCLVCAGYEVVAPDMLGHGYSSVPKSSKFYTFSSLLKDTIAVFDKYVPNTDLEQCIVIGHSFGCSLASALARYREQQIVQLILISGGGPTPLAPPVSSTEVSVFSCLQILMKPLLFCGIKRTMFYSSRGKHFEPCQSQLEAAVPSYVLRYISEGQNWPEGDAAFHRRIMIPTLLVHGMQDTLVTLVQECEMERTIPRAFLEIISSAAHHAMTETPEQLCHMLLCFMEWWGK